MRNGKLTPHAGSGSGSLRESNSPLHASITITDVRANPRPARHTVVEINELIYILEKKARN